MRNRLAGLKTYLVGPMDRAENYGRDWRLSMSDFLWSMGCGVLNPCDKPTSGAKEDNNSYNQRKLYRQNGDWELFAKEMKEIVNVDLRMVDIASFIVMYIDTDIHMCGSYNEQTHACLQRKPIIINCKQGKKGVPDWLWGICRHELFFGSWDEVKDYLTHVDRDEIVETYGRWLFLDHNKIYGGKQNEGIMGS